MAVTLVVVLIVGAVVTVVLLSGSDESAASEVFLEPVAEAGPDPFTPTVAQGAGVGIPPVDDPASDTTAPSGGVVQTSGGRPGLYGGTRDDTVCDKQQLIDFLLQNGDKGRAWAGVIGIPVADIATYVDALTPVTLISDTRVTNHGFRDGAATVLQSVLQSGTAVLVDQYGVPRVRCSCGNPLTPPVAVSTPTYRGPTWDWWSPSRVTVVTQSTTVIQVFVLTDPVTGGTFGRPTGTDGGDDTDDPETTTTTTRAPSTTSTTRSTSTTVPPTTSPPSTSPPTTSPPTTASATESDIIDLFETTRNVTCAGASYPYEAHISETITATPRPDGRWELTVIGVVSSGTQTFIWLVDPATGDFSPVSALARDAATHCSAWG